MKKRLYLLLMLLLLCAAVATVFAAGTGASARPDHLLLTWTGDTATTITISWRTDTTVTVGSVQYDRGADLTPGAKTAAAAARDFPTDLGKTRLFTATLTGLDAATQYAYRVGDGKQWSEARSFTTADPGARAVKFLVFSDSQSVAGGNAPYGVWRTTLLNAVAANPDARFLAHVGDLVDTGQSGAHWNAWFGAAAGVIERIPIMPAVGNHELYGQPASARPTYWLAQFPLPQNGPADMKGQAYSYDYGPIHFVVLDTQPPGGNFASQKTWLDADLAAADAPWTIAYFHKSPYPNKPGQENPQVKNAFCPILEKHHVDLVFCGHDHGVARTFPMRNGTRMARPSEGTIYYISGRSGTKTYRDLARQNWNAFFYNPLDQPNYLVVEVAEQTLTVRTVKQDGTAVETFVLDRAADRSTDSRQQAAPAR